MRVKDITMLELRLKQQMSLHLHFGCESLQQLCRRSFSVGRRGEGGKSIDSTSFPAGQPQAHKNEF